ncbi:MAG: hypothetical protein KY432_07875, partial [Acidobacteria bacterium]|nr:hypothetical protein [Acidobacteriota bacterium]
MKHLEMSAFRATLLTLVSSLVAASSFAADAANRDSELRSVEILSGYLDSGIEAIRRNLASSSPLKEASDSEIELRVGPRTDSRWYLQSPSETPGATTFAAEYSSGIDDLVTFHLVEEGGAWKIADIENLSYSRTRNVSTTPEQAPVPIESSLMSGVGAGPIVLGLIALLAAGGAATFRGAMRYAALVATIGAVVGGSLLAMPHLIKGEVAASVAALDDSSDETGDLRRLRWGLEAGGSPNAIADQKLIQSNGTAALWVAQSHLLNMRESEARELLDRLPNDDRDPFEQIVRARLATATGDPVASVLFYERALEQVPYSDAVRMEAIQSCLLNGYEDRARQHLDAMKRRKSRLSTPYYFLSILEAIDRDDESAEKGLLAAMQMEPPSRKSLLALPMMWDIIRRPTVETKMGLFRTREAVWEFSGKRGRPLVLSGNWVSTRSGDSLLAQHDSATLYLPGLASNAPTGAVLVDPRIWEGLERKRVLAAPERLAKLAAEQSSWLQPTTRTELTTAVVAMDESKRWPEVEQLTTALPERIETVPIEVILARSIALQGLGKSNEAKTFAASAAIAELKRENPEAPRLYQLGEMMANLQSHEIAIKLLERAETLDGDADLGDRIRQLSM